MVNSPEQPSPGCQVCSAPSGDGANLCRTHTDDLAQQLRSLLPGRETRTGYTGQTAGPRHRPELLTEYVPVDVPGLIAELETTLTRQDRAAAERHGSPSTTTPLVWNEHASTKAFELNATINAWALDVSKLGEDERDPLRPIHYTDTAAVTEWLLRNLSTLRQHGEAGQAFNELIDSITEARRAVDKPPEQVTYGPCGNTGTQEEPRDEACREYLYALPGKPIVVCRGCGAKYETEARLEWMRNYARDMLATATEAAGYLRLTGLTTTPEVVRGLAARARIKAVQVDSRGRPLYRISEVVKAISERYKRRVKAA